MRKFVFLAAALVVVLAVPGSAMAQRGPNSDNDCSWIPAGDVISDDVPGVVVYSGAGSTGDADTAVGVCVNLGNGTFDGGILELGIGEDEDDGEVTDLVGVPDSYIVADGDGNNVNPLDGYVGLSSYETDPGENKQGLSLDGECTGGAPSNGGSCLGLTSPSPVTPSIPTDDLGAGPDPITGDYQIEHGLPTPACGNSTGDQWDSEATRDGCSFPP